MNGTLEREEIDVLGRQEILDQLMRLLTTLSEARSSCSFALNGKWGSGKTFVLDRLERQLQIYRAGEQFMVFHYNCWEYDYYDEPLIAIVSAMLDNIDESTHLLSPKIREKIQRFCGVLKGIAKSAVENKVGVTVEDSEEKSDYDSYFVFHHVIEETRDGLSKLAKDQTLVVIVDELDRCLPEYAIKILERLHHLFYDLENTIVILGIDRTQLDNTIKQIFGSGTNTELYLKKFINFEICLDIGNVNSSFSEKYKDYIKLFEEVPSIQSQIDGYFIAWFSEIDARTQEQLMDRVKIVHNLLFREERKDYYFMCLELMVLIFSHFNLSFEASRFYIDSTHFYHLDCSEDLPEQFKQYFIENWHYRQIDFSTTEKIYKLPTPISISELLVYGSQQIYGKTGYACTLPDDISKRFEEEKYIEGLKQVKELLGIIKW